LRLLDSKPAFVADAKRTWSDILGSSADWGLIRAAASAPPLDDARAGRKFADRILEAATRMNFISDGSVRLVGTALERTGQINPAISFYEDRLAKTPEDPSKAELRKWLRERLLKEK